jgi:hypothetical protein
MPGNLPNQSPVLAGNAQAELARLIERSISLQDEALAINRRIKELNEQIAQRHQAASADAEASGTAGAKHQ